MRTHAHRCALCVSEEDLRCRHTGRQVIYFHVLNPHTGTEEACIRFVPDPQWIEILRASR